MYEIKAIETEYNGYLFRSRTEARWAIFFDYIGEPYEYEKECFQLPSGKYLPDFFLPKKNLWVEIKGKEPTEKEWKKCVELYDLTGNPVACVWGTPGKQGGKLCCFAAYGSGGGVLTFDVFIPIIMFGELEFIAGYELDYESSVEALYDNWGSGGRVSFIYKDCLDHQQFWDSIILPKDKDLYREAVAYSRQARFEKGVKVPRGSK